MDCSKVQYDTRKLKKKHVNNEVDRIKQAEKKKRRLEKALATSAAIRSELEKKKQKKKEEQQRLDEEGAAIAEAVALQVLLEDDPNHFGSGTQEDEGLNQWELSHNFDLCTTGNIEMVPQQNTSRYSLQGIRSVTDLYGYGCKWDDEQGDSGWMVSSEPLGSDLCWQYIEEGGLESSGTCADLITAQAVSSLTIGEETPLSAVFNQMQRG